MMEKGKSSKHAMEDVTRKDTEGVPLAREVQVETRTRPLWVRSTPTYLKEYE